MPTPMIIDIYHGDIPSGHNDIESFHALKEAGVQGAILKAGQGNGLTDPKFEDWYKRCFEVWPDCVGAYYMLDGSGNSRAQVAHFWDLTKDKKLGIKLGNWKASGRVLDYELDTVDEDTAVHACHLLAELQDEFPGMYGSDRGAFGVALTKGHFSVCWKWIARYGGLRPLHAGHLWQYQAGEDPKSQTIAGLHLDASTYIGP